MNDILLAIDPGDTESAWVLIDIDSRQPIAYGKQPNHLVLQALHGYRVTGTCSHVAIEMIASYGMPVGAEVFDTCVWIGRFTEALTFGGRTEPELTYRRSVKLHLCHSAAAKDSNITQALVDRFARGQTNFGKGTKADPGWFYGFAGDIWAAYAVAVYAADQLRGYQ